MKNKQKEVIFFKLGGTWDMIFQKGTYIGHGGLDEHNLLILEAESGFYKQKANIVTADKKLSEKIYNYITKVGKIKADLYKSLSFVPEMEKYVKGEYITLFSGDSDHLRKSLIAPIVSYLLQQIWNNQDKRILGAQGTDTADIALLPLLDVFLFDSFLPPIFFTGANKMVSDSDSDAPKNFRDVMKISHAELPPGAYWVFSDYVFPAADFVKISAFKSRVIDNFSTFFSPHLKAQKIDDVLTLRNENLFKFKKSNDHVSKNIDYKILYEKMKKIKIIDLSLENNIDLDIDDITSKDYQAIIISANSLGNMSNPIRHACIKAAMQDKLVVLVSRCLIGELAEIDQTSLLSANAQELKKRGKIIISGHKLNKIIAQALATRALYENCTQNEAQKLFNKYSLMRQLSDQDTILM